MKIDPKKLLAHYFNSAEIPFRVYIAAFLGLLFSTILGRLFPLVTIFALSKLLFFLAELFFWLMMLFAAIWNFIRKRWETGLSNLLCLPLKVFFMMALILLSWSVPNEDHFADHLSIPDNIEIAEPMDWSDEKGLEDGFQESLIAERKTLNSGIPSVTAQISSLIQLHKNAPDILKRYLSSSLSWKVFKESGSLYATRRLKEDFHWRRDSDGSYNYRNDDSLIPDFQTGFTIVFSGEPWWRISNTNHLKEGQTDNLILSPGYHLMYESTCVITGDEIYVEVSEQSNAKERRLTKAALAYVENELHPLSESPSWNTTQNILHLSSIRQGNPSFKIWGTGGDYDSQIWINPEEKGMIYLKAYEVTQNIQLSAEGLKEESSEWIGWSDNPNELFFSNTNFKIFEGDWGKPYAARFEVWFVPDSGAAERKLMAKVFKIEGWQGR